MSENGQHRPQKWVAAAIPGAVLQILETYMATAASAGTVPGPMTPEEKKVIFASSLGTVFEWYDFYLYGTLAAIIGKQFFSNLDLNCQVIL